MNTSFGADESFFLREKLYQGLTLTNEQCIQKMFLMQWI